MSCSLGINYCHYLPTPMHMEIQLKFGSTKHLWRFTAKQCCNVLLKTSEEMGISFKIEKKKKKKHQNNKQAQNGFTQLVRRNPSLQNKQDPKIL